jgi:tetratricopeptide (TPR) repeat protein
MNAVRHPIIPLAGIAALSLTLACVHEARTLKIEPDPQPFSLLETLLGESRRLFANHFFIKADAYFHSGYYPTIFDNRESYQTPHVAADAGLAEEKNKSEDELGFLGKPLDPLEAFGRKFFPAEHTHLDEGGASSAEDHHDHAHHDHDHDHAHHDHGEDKAGKDSEAEVREILPWLKLSTALDPNRVDTYTVTAYWLRNRLHKSREAEEILREGLRRNPRNPAILFELGRIYLDDRKDLERARNLFEAGITSWQRIEAGKKEPDVFQLHQLFSYLAELEERAGNDAKAIELWERVKTVAGDPSGPEKHIADLKAKAAKAAGK